MATPENRKADLEDHSESHFSGEQEGLAAESEGEPSGGEAPLPAGVDSTPLAPPTAAAAATPRELPTASAGPTTYRKRPIFLDFDLLQLAAIFFLLDQLSKFLVRAYLPFGHSYPDRGFFRFTHAENTGSAFGILQGHNTPLIFVSFVGIFVLAMIYQSQPRPTALLRLSLGLQIGGALGNLVDRFRLGAVTDFIDVGPWPIFNLADASIISGLALLGWILLRHGGRETDGVASVAAARDYSLKRRGRCAAVAGSTRGGVAVAESRARGEARAGRLGVLPEGRK